MGCSKILKKLSAYSDGELSDKESALISAHLKECETCREEIRFISSLKKSITESGRPFFQTFAKESERENLNLWPLVKSKISQTDNRRAHPRESIFEKYIYKLSLAGAMLLYLLADFDPVGTTIFWFYFLFHLVVYSDKFDSRKMLIKI